MQEFIEINSLKRQVLVVDDELINREILGAMLSQSYETVFAENGRQAMELLLAPEQNFSLILLDLLMPEMDGFTVIERCQADERLKKIPIIVMTSEKEAEVRSIRMGAADFITKPYDMPEVILARCERIIDFSEDKNIIQSTEKDSLTGLYTKEFFFAYIHRLAPQSEQNMTALALNIDRFHLINELFGRQEGNSILKKTADLICKYILGSHGIACRVESDLFYVYCRRRDNYEALIKQMQEELSKVTKARNLHLCAGIYEDTDASVVPEIRFDRARSVVDSIHDRYDAHAAFYTQEQHERSVFREQLIGGVQEAIDNRQLAVYFQPKYRITGERPELVSAEALVRWKHPELGMISPGAFIPLFEHNGLISKVDHFVWREAAAQIRRWKDTYGVTIPVSVNVSRVEFFDAGPEEKLLRILAEQSLDTSDLMPEITESAFADNGERLIEIVSQMRADGFQIEMDDFGTGYSSLNMLTSIPIDALKLDMGFIRNMSESPKNRKLVELMIDIAHFWGVPVIAEGVEEEHQLDLLKKMGCDIIQGYCFSPPVPADAFEKLIEKEIRIRRENV